VAAPTAAAHSSSLGSAEPTPSVVKVRGPVTGAGVGGRGVRTTVGSGAGWGAVRAASVAAGLAVGVSVGALVRVGTLATLGEAVTSVTLTGDVGGVREADTIEGDALSRVTAVHALTALTRIAATRPTDSLIPLLTLDRGACRVLVSERYFPRCADGLPQAPPQDLRHGPV
jgi:hypothetical protein